MKTIVISLLLWLCACAVQAAPLRIVALGDSLTAGYGLRGGQDYASQLEMALKRANIDAVVDNAGVSGDTSAGGVSRLEWAIAGDTPALVIVALGGNDMLRGIPADVTRKNLTTILQKLAEKNIPALLYGMKTPGNFPVAYRTAFEGLYPTLAEKFGVPLYPFFLEGVALNPQLNLPDGVHPNTKGISVMVEKTLPHVKAALEAKEKTREIQRASS